MASLVYEPRGVTRQIGNGFLGFLSDNKTKKQRKRQKKGEGLEKLFGMILKAGKSLAKKKGSGKFKKYQRGKKGGFIPFLPSNRKIKKSSHD